MLNMALLNIQVKESRFTVRLEQHLTLAIREDRLTLGFLDLALLLLFLLFLFVGAHSSSRLKRGESTASNFPLFLVLRVKVLPGGDLVICQLRVKVKIFSKLDALVCGTPIRVWCFRCMVEEARRLYLLRGSNLTVNLRLIRHVDAVPLIAHSSLLRIVGRELNVALFDDCRNLSVTLETAWINRPVQDRDLTSSHDGFIW